MTAVTLRVCIFLTSVLTIPTGRTLGQEPEPYPLWDPATPFPELQNVPLVDQVTHVIVHRATKGVDQFFHGAAIVRHKGT